MPEQRVHIAGLDWWKLVGLIYVPVAAAAGWAWSIDQQMSLNGERMAVNAATLNAVAQSLRSLEQTVNKNGTRLSVIEATQPKLKHDP